MSGSSESEWDSTSSSLTDRAPPARQKRNAGREQNSRRTVKSVATRARRHDTSTTSESTTTVSEDDSDEYTVSSDTDTSSGTTCTSETDSSSSKPKPPRASKSKTRIAQGSSTAITTTAAKRGGSRRPCRGRASAHSTQRVPTSTKAPKPRYDDDDDDDDDDFSDDSSDEASTTTCSTSNGSTCSGSTMTDDSVKPRSARGRHGGGPKRACDDKVDKRRGCKTKKAMTSAAKHNGSRPPCRGHASTQRVPTSTKAPKPRNDDDDDDDDFSDDSSDETSTTTCSTSNGSTCSASTMTDDSDSQVRPDHALATDSRRTAGAPRHVTIGGFRSDGRIAKPDLVTVSPSTFKSPSTITSLTFEALPMLDRLCDGRRAKLFNNCSVLEEVEFIFHSDAVLRDRCQAPRPSDSPFGREGLAAHEYATVGLRTFAQEFLNQGRETATLRRLKINGMVVATSDSFQHGAGGGGTAPPPAAKEREQSAAARGDQPPPPPEGLHIIFGSLRGFGDLLGSGRDSMMPFASDVSWLRHVCFGPTVFFPELQEVPAFHECSSLETVLLCNAPKVWRVPERCFYRCYSLRSVYISATANPLGGNNVTTIGPYAFDGCAALEDFNVWDHYPFLTRLDKDAFKGCPKLQSLLAPLMSCATYNSLMGPDRGGGESASLHDLTPVRDWSPLALRRSGQWPNDGDYHSQLMRLLPAPVSTAELTKRLSVDAATGQVGAVWRLSQPSRADLESPDAGTGPHPLSKKSAIEHVFLPHSPGKRAFDEWHTMPNVRTVTVGSPMQYAAPANSGGLHNASHTEAPSAPPPASQSASSVSRSLKNAFGVPLGGPHERGPVLELGGRPLSLMTVPMAWYKIERLDLAPFPNVRHVAVHFVVESLPLKVCGMKMLETFTVAGLDDRELPTGLFADCPRLRVLDLGQLPRLRRTCRCVLDHLPCLTTLAMRGGGGGGTDERAVRIATPFLRGCPNVNPNVVPEALALSVEQWRAVVEGRDVPSSSQGCCAIS